MTPLENLIDAAKSVSLAWHEAEIDDKFINDLDSALAAYDAEIEKRREGSPWKGPFIKRTDTVGNYSQHFVMDGCEGRVIRGKVQTVYCVAAALNEYLRHGERP